MQKYFRLESDLTQFKVMTLELLTDDLFCETGLAGTVQRRSSFASAASYTTRRRTPATGLRMSEAARSTVSLKSNSLLYLKLFA